MSLNLNTLTPDAIRGYYQARLPNLPSRASSSGEVSVPCRFHDDGNPSMSINLETGLWFCHAEQIGGNLVQFEQRLKGYDYVTALREVSRITGVNLQPPHADGWTLEAVHAYCDEADHVLFEVVRWRDQDGQKQIRQRKPRPGGGYTYKLDEGGAVRRVLYNLSALIRAGYVIVTEGEKDADLVAGLDWSGLPGFAKAALAVTTNPGGAGKWKPDFSPFLTGKIVCIFRDNDEEGIRHAEAVAQSLYPFTKRIKVIAPPTHDVGDWVKEGATASDLQAAIKAAPWWTPPAADLDGLRVDSAAELIQMDVAPREMLLEPIIPNQGLVMLHSKRGVGKTYLALGIAHAVATGGEFLEWKAPNAVAVLYLDGELPLATLKERVATVCGPETSENLKFITPDRQTGPMPDLSTPEGQAAIERHLDGVKLLVVDNLSALCRSGKENEGESWLQMQEFILRLRRKGISVLLIHHAGKNGTQRGTSRREDLLDTVIALRHPADYDPREGLRSEVRYEKARRFFGNAAQEFEVRMDIQGGSASWAIGGCDRGLAEVIANMKKDGSSIRQIADELGISKSKAHRLLQQNRQMPSELVPASQCEDR